MEELRNEGENILIVNGNQPIEMVFHELIEGIKVYFPKFFTKKESQQIDLLTDHLIKK